MFIRTIIIDDEPAICSELEFLLKNHIDIQVIGVYTNPLEALSAIIADEPDLIFLDIQMPGMNGMDLAKKLNQLSRPPLIVFSTAFHEHALEAFSTPAVGYLTKPIAEAKLEEVIKKVRMLWRRPDAHAQAAPPSPQLEEHVCIRKNNKIIPLHASQIFYAFVRDKDVYVGTKESVEKCDLTLNELEAILQRSRSFFRSHRNYILNLKQIREIVPWFNNTYLIRMKDDNQTEIPVSRGKMKAFRGLMNL